MTTDERYMTRCIELARCGELGAAPNPMVGAVIVCDDRIIGEGYHIRCGGPHAEVNAFRSVKDESLLLKSTLYVSLEPCAHFGKTPPCAALVVEKRVRRVVVGCVDPFAKVQGRGIQMIREAGIEVEVGVLEEECKALNRRFFTFHTLQRPYITLKWAQTHDGIMGICNNGGPSDRLYISCPQAMRRVHHLRATHNAILVGYNTVKTDNPSLTTRCYDGPNPLRVVIDPHGHLTREYRVFNTEAPTIVFGYKANETLQDVPNVRFCQLQDNDDVLPQVMRQLHADNIQSVLVEGGRATLDAFLQSSLWDYIHVEHAAMEAKPHLTSQTPVMAPVLDLVPDEIESIGTSKVYHYNKKA